MLRDIRKAFEQSVMKEQKWMDAATRVATADKSRRMKEHIGFPEWLLDDQKLEQYYRGVLISESTHMENMLSVLNWRMRLQLESLHSAEDGMHNWATDPISVNAFHTFQTNAITVPIAILQYPFYHLGLEALNYGSLGSILGHELTHGFDDSGRQYDKEGNLRQWWSEDTVEKYIEKTKCFIDQYSKFYMPDIGEYINGELTLGENIADNGGLREAFAAYQIYIKENGRESYLPGFEDFTHEQLFFLSYGNLWCETSTPESSRWALEDEHCPGKYRLRGVLTNSKEFSKAWKCKLGSGMNPNNDKCTIW
ncbi:neprilysin-1-like [Ctenocephalides felis]|uniref:neprilysin-1-like n=1 Tax=Ctenocephalides felis TaxID=7515 RepID=UPI000E6E54BB|nr:neprilysin-1-like [Ctenocephalides felis]